MHAKGWPPRRGTWQSVRVGTGQVACREGSKRKSPKGAKADLMAWGAGEASRGQTGEQVPASPADTSSSPLSEQARAAAGQLLRWKQDAHQDGYLLLKSAFVLSGTDSVSAGNRGLASSPPGRRPRLRAGCISQRLSSQEAASPFSARLPSGVGTAPEILGFWSESCPVTDRRDPEHMRLSL